MENSKTLNKKINFLIIANLALIVLALCLLNYTDIDVKIQNHLFNFKSKTWLIDKNEPIKKFIFYQFPKILFGSALVFSLVGAVLGFEIIRTKTQFFAKNRQRFLLIFLGLSLIPLVAGNIKKFTNTYCPNQLEIFDGKYRYAKVLEFYPNNFYQEKKGKCFPAGHCVTGFALLILFFALEKKSQRVFALLSSLTLGWVMGFYQMAKGVHFFGDTLISMLVCFFLASMIYKFYLRFFSPTLPKIF
jgi:membrane-associated PAP2 superfamily phosphatase